MRVERSLYEVLDVSPTATDEQIRRAYRVAARRTHPDAGGSSPAFERVAIAYQVLADPDRRRRYDLRLAAGTTGTTGTTGTGSGTGSPARRPAPPSGAGPRAAPGAAPGPPGQDPGVPPTVSPGADPVVRRRYLIMMGVALALFISAGTVVRLVSLPAAMIMMLVAALIPPIAVTVAGRSRPSSR